MNCASKLIQVIFVLLNLVFLALSVVLLMSGSEDFTHGDHGSLMRWEGGGNWWFWIFTHANNAVSLLVGSTTIVMLLVGIWSGITKSRVCLAIYATMLVFVLIAETVFAILLFAKSANESSLESYASNAWDLMINDRLNIQQNRNCCGFSSPVDRFGEMSASMANLMFRNATVCSSTSYTCDSVLKTTIADGMRATGALFFGLSGCQVLTLLLALVLIFDYHMHKLKGYSKWDESESEMIRNLAKK